MNVNGIKKSVLMSSLFLFLSVLLVACSTNKASNEADSSYVLVKELEFVNQSLEEKESGVYIYKGRIKNNSKYTIRGISVEIELDNQNYTTLTTQDILLPGETSSYIECFGPASGNIEDMKATRITINMYDDEFRQTQIQYDVNQGKYTYVEDNATRVEPLVVISDLELVNPTLSETNLNKGIVYQASIANHSNYVVTGIIYTFQTNENQTINLVELDSIGANATSPVLSCPGPITGNLEDMQLKQVKYSVIDSDNNSQQITYDVRLDHYFVK